jgi:hypothetical protein
MNFAFAFYLQYLAWVLDMWNWLNNYPGPFRG